MNVAILGTLGIPNNYGGFEQCAEKLALLFVQAGINVTVYSTIEHNYKDNKWRRVTIKHVYSNKSILAGFNAFVIDYLAFVDAIRNGYQIILVLGSAPTSLYYNIKKNRRFKIVTNLAGLEWKRSKWGWATKSIIKYLEKLSVYNSDCIISDNLGIQQYVANEYGMKSRYIPYGAEKFDKPNPAYLDEFGLLEGEYYITVARFQPDNNLEMILDGYLLSGVSDYYLVVGSWNNKYGKYLKKKYANNKRIIFPGGIYDYSKLSSLRWYSKIYFHGHSCGGTNPALLEAIASKAFIAAQDNVFNRHVLLGDGLYFSNSEDVAEIILSSNSQIERERQTQANLKKLELEYNWSNVSNQYIQVFKEVLNSS